MYYVMNESSRIIIYSTIFGICVGTLLFFVDNFSRKIIFPAINIVIPIDGNINIIFLIYYIFIIYFIFNTVDYFLKHSFLT